MKKIVMFLAVFLVIIVSAFSTAHSQEVLINHERYTIMALGESMHFDGDFVPGVSQTISAQMSIGKFRTLSLNSRGGSAEEAYRLGAFLARSKEIDVYIAPGSKCLSACAFALASAAPRVSIDGIAGMHRAYMPRYNYTESIEDISEQNVKAVMVMVENMMINGYSFTFAKLVATKTSYDTFLMIDSVDMLMKFKTNTVTTPPQHTIGLTYMTADEINDYVSSYRKKERELRYYRTHDYIVNNM